MNNKALTETDILTKFITFFGNFSLPPLTELTAAEKYHELDQETLWPSTIRRPRANHVFPDALLPVHE